MKLIGSVILLPDRVEHFLKVLDSMELAYPFFIKIYIHIVHFYKRLNKSITADELDRLKNFLKDFIIPTEIIFHVDDIGPSLKLMGILPYTKNQDYIYIFDDDVYIYPSLISLLIENVEKYGDHAVYGIMGCRENEFIHGEYIFNTPYENVDIIGGYRGAIYPRKCIHTNDFMTYINIFIEHFKNTNYHIAMHDDHIFGAYLKKKNIERRIINIYPKLNNKQLYYKQFENKNGIFQDKNTYDNYEIVKKLIHENE